MSFNMPLQRWNVRSVTRMQSMFMRSSSFNQPLNGWDVSRVTNMLDMFTGASRFNQPLDAWRPTSVYKSTEYGVYRCLYGLGFEGMFDAHTLWPCNHR